MNKIIKLVLILGILAFSMLNSVQAQDKVLCCPDTTEFDKGTNICHGVTKTSSLRGGTLSPLILPKNPFADGALRAVEDNDCKNIIHPRVIASWKKVKTLSTESSGRLSGVDFVKSLESDENIFPAFFPYVVKESNGNFIDKRVWIRSREDRERNYYDCNIIKIVRGKEIQVLCKRDSPLTPKIGSRTAGITISQQIPAIQPDILGKGQIAGEDLRDAPRLLTAEELARTVSAEGKDEKCTDDYRNYLEQELITKREGGIISFNAAGALKQLSLIYDPPTDKCIITSLKLHTSFLEEGQEILIDKLPNGQTLKLLSLSEISYENGVLKIETTRDAFSYGGKEIPFDTRDSVIIEKGKTTVFMENRENLELIDKIKSYYREYWTYRDWTYRSKYDNILFSQPTVKKTPKDEGEAGVSGGEQLGAGRTEDEGGLPTIREAKEGLKGREEAQRKAAEQLGEGGFFRE